MHEISLATASKQIRTIALNKIAKAAKQPVWEVMAEIERGNSALIKQLDEVVSEGIECFLLLVSRGKYRLKHG